ncbi:uncharacterized protein LOC133323464, partial [Musca vetustissima]|uniref:uncharacterized protein LOC133323464 n=1 Tax=Musca vetustissima TaxID=27455 RepID=UPI002AB6786D
MSSDSCLICVRNFINRRGVPETIRSDNETNFVGIAKDPQGITTFLDTNSASSGLTALGIKWAYNTPLKAANGSVLEQNTTLETLQAFLIETENMVNSRARTHLPDSPEDPDPANHFLLG